MRWLKTRLKAPVMDATLIGLASFTDLGINGAMGGDPLRLTRIDIQRVEIEIAVCITKRHNKFAAVR